MKIEVTIKTITDDLSWLESHAGLAAWVQAAIALVGLLGIAYAVREIKKKERVERKLETAFVRFYMAEVASMLTSIERVAANVQGGGWLGIFNDSYMADIARAAERPDWVGLEASSLSKQLQMRVEYANKLIASNVSKDDPAFVQEKLTLCLMVITKQLKELSQALKSLKTVGK